MQAKTVFEYPHLIALLIVLLCGSTLSVGTGAVLAAWYCACLSNQCRVETG